MHASKCRFVQIQQTIRGYVAMYSALHMYEIAMSVSHFCVFVWGMQERRRDVKKIHSN